MPIVQDAVSHTFWKIQHMATVHYENGKYHLHTELANDANEDKDDAKRANLIKQNQNLANHLPQQLEEIVITGSEISKVFFPPFTFPNEIFIETLIQPPNA